ncbi:serine hydrolase domain-containing protein [Allosphingosinicella deserti]|uniref:serine hydrolase domain-containing protein n=1 Tax=Allosphingosinicella deserti TaxID=2116704 RepID=UPI0018EC2637|nr:serine hydrolase domain-containing protein [Sphingomonas deserti]
MRVAFTALMLLCGTSALAQTAAAPAPAAPEAPAKLVSISEDLPSKTASGLTFTAPKGWSMRTAPGIVELIAPEGDFRMAIVEVGAAADAKAAAAAAWARFAPAEARPAKLVTMRAARNGWDERQAVDYEVSPNEKRAMQAIAFRKGTAWTVGIIAGSEATAEKRGAALNLVASSLRPAGYTRESFAGHAARPMDAARIAELRTFLEQSMQALGIPGAAFALTDRSRTFHAEGLGVRELGKPTKVDPDSTFMIASNTKGMATLLLAKLVDEGKLRWDQPVTDVYPAFKLGSSETTSKVLIRHLVCACTGLPRKDFEWIFNTSAKTPASDTFVQLAATQPTSGFGEVFQYNNLMASAAGYVGGHIVHPELELGAAFDRAMEEKVFGPIGMRNTTFDFDRATAGNWARPHSDDMNSKPTPIVEAGMAFNRAIAPFRPAGGAWSTANDLIKYVRFELNEGKTDDGRQWVSPKNLLERRVANVPVGEDIVYGMGLQTNSYWGVPVVHHGGSMGGYKSDIVIVPGANLGAVILTNSDNGQALLRPFMRRLLELVYDGKPEAVGDVAAAAARIKAEVAKERERLTVPPDPKVIAALAPAYVSPELGRLALTRTADGATLTLAGSPMAIGTRANDDGTTSLVVIDPTFLGFPLVVANEGGKRRLIARDGQHEYVFEGE